MTTNTATESTIAAVRLGDEIRYTDVDGTVWIGKVTSKLDVRFDGRLYCYSIRLSTGARFAASPVRRCTII